MPVSFVNLTRGNPAVLQIGDLWSIVVTGAPNAPVSVIGGKDGGMANTVMGSTDGSGTFRLSGAIAADQVGRWTEAWKVAGQDAGSFAFIVAQASAPVTTPVVGSVPAAAVPHDFSVPDSGIPVWALAAGVGVVALMIFGRGR